MHTYLQQIQTKCKISPNDMQTQTHLTAGTHDRNLSSEGDRNKYTSEHLNIPFSQLYYII